MDRSTAAPPGGPANGLPVPSAPPSIATMPATGRLLRRLFCGWLATVLLGLTTAAGIAAPPGVPVAGDISIDDLANRSTKLEAAGQWAELVSLCEPAARKGSLSPDLFARYDLAKIHCDLARRSAELAYQQELSQLSENDARRLYKECLSRIVSHHVEQPDFRRLVDRGCLAMEVAVTDPEFCRMHARQATPERIGQFRDHLSRIVAGRTITNSFHQHAII